MKNSGSPYFSAIVPFYNEEAAAPPLLQELRAVLDGMGQSYEVLCVDDGSGDGTAAALETAARLWPQCRVVRFAQNQGQAAGLFWAFQAAQGQIFRTLDGDGQNDPTDLPRLVARLAQADYVGGVRAQRQDSPLRRRMSRLANAVRSRVLGDGMTDTGCALKVFRREVREAYLPLRTLYSFMPALAKGAGFVVVEEPVHHRARHSGLSKYGLGAMWWRPLVDMAGLWWFLRRRCPSPSRIALHPGGQP